MVVFMSKAMEYRTFSKKVDADHAEDKAGSQRDTHAHTHTQLNCRVIKIEGEGIFLSQVNQQESIV